MNQIITDLAEHADFYVGNEHYDKSKEEQQRLWVEELARLIIQECIDALDINDGSEHHSIALIEHFGIEETRKSTYTDCDCGCNIPVAKTPEKMLRFLANRLEFAGVADSVASIYARDIRKLIEEHYDSKPKERVQVTAEMVQHLRDKSDCPMMECKNALIECNGDMNKAMDWLRTPAMLRKWSVNKDRYDS